MIMEDATPRRFKFSSFQEIAANDEVQEAISRSIQTATLDFNEIALRSRAQMCEFDPTGKRRTLSRRYTYNFYRRRRTSSAPMKLKNMSDIMASSSLTASRKRNHCSRHLNKNMSAMQKTASLSSIKSATSHVSATSRASTTSAMSSGPLAPHPLDHPFDDIAAAAAAPPVILGRSGGRHRRNKTSFGKHRYNSVDISTVLENEDLGDAIDV